ncbi:MAG: hypothetical protein Kow0031_24180 [Anaerolineae bacterium]
MPAERRRIILIVLVVVLLLCLVGAVALNMFNRGGGGDDVAQQPAATATEAQQEEPTPAPEPTEAEPTPEPEPTATPEPPTPEPTATEAAESDMAAASAGEGEAEAPTEGEASAEAATPGEAGGDDAFEPPAGGEQAAPVVNVQMVEVTEVGEILKNGDFEDGFAENGVAQSWQSFATVGGAVNFSAENSDPFLKDGQHAQRISIDQTFEPDQYGGIQQTVDVIPGESYTVTIYGQIRSNFGSVQSSNYGYRVQMALGQNGAADWSSIPPADWVELPWPEQSLSVSTVEFSEYSDQFVATGDKLTLFVRGWNKWPDGTLGEYTFDGLSIVGPMPGSTEMVAVTVPGGEATTPAPADSATTGDDAAAMAPPAAEGEMVDKGLPVTGLGDGPNLMQDGRFWGALVVLMLLLAGAVYRSGWRW